MPLQLTKYIRIFQCLGLFLVGSVPALSEGNAAFERFSESCPANSSINYDAANNKWEAPKGWTVVPPESIAIAHVPPYAALSRKFVPYRSLASKKLADVTCSYSLDKTNVLVLKKTYEQSSNIESPFWGPSGLSRRQEEGASGLKWQNYYYSGVDYAMAKEASWASKKFINRTSICETTASNPEKCSIGFWTRGRVGSLWG